MQRDGLDCGTAVAAVRGASADIGARGQGIEIDAGDGVDGIDGGETIGASTFRSAGDGADVSNVGGEFDQHRRACDFLHPFGDHAGVLRHLPDGGAHAALAHAVRASEVELESIGAGIFRTADNVVPRLALGIHHQGGNYGVVRVALLDLGNFAEVGVDGTV